MGTVAAGVCKTSTTIGICGGAGTVRGETTGGAVGSKSTGGWSYRRLIKASHPEQAIWLAASDREFVKCIEERKTFHPIYESEKPKDRVVSYLNMQCKKKFSTDSNPDSAFDARVRATYGGNLTDYSGDRSAQTSSMTDFKILLNKTVSMTDRKFVTADATDFYLIDNPLDRSEYMRLKLDEVSP